MTIDELARESGLSVRNIRSHVTRGLLPNADTRGRKAYYTQEHLDRIRVIKELQDDGLSLKTVERILVGRNASEPLLALRRAVLQTSVNVDPVAVSRRDLVARFEGLDDAMIAQAVRLGAIGPRADGRYEVQQPALLDLAEQVSQLGVPIKAALNLTEALNALSEVAARQFVNVAVTELLLPFLADGEPEDGWDQVGASVSQLKPLADELMHQLLPQAISAEARAAFGAILGKRARSRPAGPPPKTKPDTPIPTARGPISA